MELNQLLKDMREYAKQNYVPIIVDDSMELLMAEIDKNKPKRVLEIGTAIGYSAICMKSHMDEQSCIVSLEKDANRYQIATQNIELSGLTNIELILGDAYEYLVNCKSKFDFIFLDGPKGWYLRYLPYLIKLLDDNGVIFTDNIYFHGLTQRALNGEKVQRKQRTIAVNMAKFVTEITNNPSLNVVLRHEGDGIAIITKKSI